MPFEALNDRTLITAGAVLFAGAFLLPCISLFNDREYARRISMTLLLVGFVVQSLGLYIRGLENHALPLSNTFEVLQVLAWSAVALNLVVRQAFHLRLLNVFTSGFAAVLSAVSVLIPSWDFRAPPSALDGSPWVGFHAGLAIFSYGVFGVLAITSLMYLIQNYGLQHMRSGRLFALLPAIRQLEDINGRLIVVGVSVLSLSIGIGLLNWLEEPKTIGLLKLVVAALVWAAYLTILYLRKKNVLIAGPFARTCVFLFFAALLSLWPLTHRGSLTSEIDSVEKPLQASESRINAKP